MASSENRLPTERFSLPGMGLPWQRQELHSLKPVASAPKPLPVAERCTLDAAQLTDDPIAGWDVGACQVMRRLTVGSARVLLGLRENPKGGAALVVMRKLDGPDLSAHKVAGYARFAEELKHPLLPRVFPAEVCDEGIFWVSEYAPGATLSELAIECHRIGKGLPLGLVLGLVHDAAVALGELHSRGVAHGLVTDQAIAACFDGTSKLLDVGLFSCLARKSTWNEVLELTGPYLSPEQVLQGRPPDPKADVFSLGVVLHEALSGSRLPRGMTFDARVRSIEHVRFVPPSHLNVSLNKQVDEVVMRALKTDRSGRYETAAQFARELKSATNGFIWGAERRAEFVAKLFEYRKAHSRTLVDGLAPARTRTISSAAVKLPTWLNFQIQPTPAPTAAPVATKAPALAKNEDVLPPIVEGVELAEEPKTQPGLSSGRQWFGFFACVVAVAGALSWGHLVETRVIHPPVPHAAPVAVAPVPVDDVLMSEEWLSVDVPQLAAEPEPIASVLLASYTPPKIAKKKPSGPRLKPGEVPLPAWLRGGRR